MADMVFIHHRPEYYGITEDEQEIQLWGVATYHKLQSHRNWFGGRCPIGNLLLNWQNLEIFEDNLLGEEWTVSGGKFFVRFLLMMNLIPLPIPLSIQSKMDEIFD